MKNLKNVRIMDLVTELKKRYKELFIVGHLPIAQLGESKIGSAVDVHTKFEPQTAIHSVMRGILTKLLRNLDRRTAGRRYRIIYRDQISQHIGVPSNNPTLPYRGRRRSIPQYEQHSSLILR